MDFRPPGPLEVIDAGGPVTLGAAGELRRVEALLEHSVAAT